MEIEHNLNNHLKNLLTLHDVPHIQAIIRAQENQGTDPENGNSLQEWRTQLTSIFSAFLSNHTEYLQLRFIDAAGNELVRVQTTADGNIIAIPDNALQNKADRLYVSETIKLKPKQVYYSDVTLNHEHGVIQEPRTSVLRIATPIHNTTGDAVALIVINFSTEQLFSNVRSEDNGIQRNIVDEKGHYIKHLDLTRIFGLEQTVVYTFQDVEPMLAELSAHQDQYMRRHEIHMEVDGFQKIYFSPQDRSRYWLVTLNVPENVVFSGIDAALNKMLFISLLIGMLSLLTIIWFISRKILTPVVNLATAARQLQEGDLSVRVDAASANDEFHTLYKAINAFANNQQQTTAQLKKKVAAQTKRLTAVIDNVVDGIITISQNGIIQSFNPAAKKTFGYSEDEVIGHNIKMLMPEPYHTEHDGYLQHHIKTGEKKVIGIGREVTGQRKDGTTFPMELAVSNVVIDNIQHFVGITRDITERKRVETMQKEFISTVSHELRTPLTSIRGSLGLILSGVTGALPDKMEHLLSIANNNSERLIDLINDILDLEKITAGKMQFDNTITNLLPIIQQAVESNKGYADQLNVRFKLVTNPNDVAMVFIDEKRIAQVMANLLSNAAKYSPTNEQVEVSVMPTNDHIRISVHDHGKGIPEAFKARIFKKFAQADSSDSRQKGGTGLGLSITKAIVEMQGGDLSFDSHENQGTTFHVDLPRWNQQHKHTSHINNADADVPLILVIEDNHEVAKLLCMMLENEGYRTHQAYNYQEAIQQIKNSHYNAITLDITIPGGCGITLLHEIRNKKTTMYLPVIIVSARNNNGQLDGGAFTIADWIEKPIDEKKLLCAIRAALSPEHARHKRILHVEDDSDISIIMSTLLGNEYQVVHAITLKQAKQLMRENQFDLVLLDIGLPDGSGLSLLPVLNDQTRHTPVIIFSAQKAPPTIAAQVQAVLIKSKTNNEQLLRQIKQAIKSPHQRQ